MTEPTQLLPGVWLLPTHDGQLNSGVLLAEHQAIIVDPGTAEEDLAALDSFIRNSGSEVAVVALTHARSRTAPDPSRWGNAAPLMPPELSGVPGPESKPANTLSALGWEVLFFGPGRLGLYTPRRHALFSGDMLSE